MFPVPIAAFIWPGVLVGFQLEIWIEVPASKTIDEFREEYRQSLAFHEAYNTPASHAYAELEMIVLESLAVTGNVTLFANSDDGLQRTVLRDLRRFRRTGECVWVSPHSGIYTDGRPRCRAAISALTAAGLLPPFMTHIADPLPRFSGLTFIRGTEQLVERVSCDQDLLDVELVALAQDVPNPLGHPNHWSVALQMIEYERHNIDRDRYQRVAVRSCIATFAMRNSVSVYFWPRFSFGYVNHFRVKRVESGRGKTRLDIKLHMHSKGRLSCDDMELLRLEEIDVS